MFLLLRVYKTAASVYGDFHDWCWRDGCFRVHSLIHFNGTLLPFYTVFSRNCYSSAAWRTVGLAATATGGGARGSYVPNALYHIRRLYSRMRRWYNVFVASLTLCWRLRLDYHFRGCVRSRYYVSAVLLLYSASLLAMSTLLLLQHPGIMCT